MFIYFRLIVAISKNRKLEVAEATQNAFSRGLHKLCIVKRLKLCQNTVPYSSQRVPLASVSHTTLWLPGDRLIRVFCLLSAGIT